MGGASFAKIKFKPLPPQNVRLFYMLPTLIGSACLPAPPHPPAHPFMGAA